MYKFVLPEYKGGSLLNIPSTFLKIFGGQPLKDTLPKSYYQNALGCEKILFCLFDGFGHNLYQKVGKKYPFFKKYADRGIYNPITTVFPSTTAAAISTINCGVSPFEHGLPEWYIYFQELDAIFESLPFIPALAEDLGKEINAPENILFNQKTIYQHLAEINIPSYIILPTHLVSSFYNLKSNTGATVVPYKTYPHLMVVLRKLLEETKGKAYFYAYISAIDGAEHSFSPWTEEVEAEISSLSYLLDNEFLAKLDKETASKTALFMSADHGQVPTYPEKTIYLNDISGFDELLDKSSAGKIIFPTGNIRDISIHIKPESLDEAIKLLESNLPEGTRVLKMEDCINQGWFGQGKIHPEFMSRVGNLLILPDTKDTIWYRYTPESKYKLSGNHGGLSEDEMLIPFVSARLADLQ